jgi:hypothetical protein
VSIRCTVNSGVVRVAVGAWTKSLRLTRRRATTRSKGATICEYAISVLILSTVAAARSIWFGQGAVRFRNA